MKPETRIYTVLIVVHILISGCFVNQNITPDLPSTTVEFIPENQEKNFTGTHETDKILAEPNDRAVFDSVNVTVHSLETIHKGKENFVFLTLTLVNEKISEGFSLDTASLVCFDQNSGDRFYPVSENLPMELKDPILPATLRMGQEKKGTVVFNVWDSVKSINVYVGYPNGTFVGESVISDISQNSTDISDVVPPKKMGLIVHSAVQHRTLPGWNNQPGTSIAEINVSITNYQPHDIRLIRENIFILFERGMALEHGGDRTTPEIARNYLRFPLSIAAGDTETGTIVYIIYRGRKINQLVLTDRNFVIHSMADLNDHYHSL